MFNCVYMNIIINIINIIKRDIINYFLFLKNVVNMVDYFKK